MEPFISSHLIPKQHSVHRYGYGYVIEYTLEDNIRGRGEVG